MLCDKSRIDDTKMSLFPSLPLSPSLPFPLFLIINPLKAQLAEQVKLALSVLFCWQLRSYFLIKTEERHADWI